MGAGAWSNSSIGWNVAAAECNMETVSYVALLLLVKSAIPSGWRMYLSFLLNPVLLAQRIRTVSHATSTSQPLYKAQHTSAQQNLYGGLPDACMKACDKQTSGTVSIPPARHQHSTGSSGHISTDCMKLRVCNLLSFPAVSECDTMNRKKQQRLFLKKKDKTTCQDHVVWGQYQMQESLYAAKNECKLLYCTACVLPWAVHTPHHMPCVSLSRVSTSCHLLDTT
jgi:hypothetical protein